MYISIISEVYTNGINEERTDKANNSVKALSQANEIAKALEDKNMEIEWIQSSTTDGKNVYTTLTAIVSSIRR